MKIVLAVVIGLVLAGCGGTAAPTPASDETPASTARVTPTPRATAAETPAATPEPTDAAETDPPAEVDPDVAFGIFKGAFWDNFEELYTNDIADAIESDYVFVDSVDRVRYDADKHRISFTITSDYELLYANDHEEWRSDTWDFFRDYAREIWGGTKDGMGDEMAGVPIPWEEWTPSIRIVGNDDRLLVECPGSLINRISDRDGDQSDFADECRFKYGRG
jgi:hypothetical protein